MQPSKYMEKVHIRMITSLSLKLPKGTQKTEEQRQGLDLKREKKKKEEENLFSRRKNSVYNASGMSKNKSMGRTSSNKFHEEEIILEMKPRRS